MSKASRFARQARGAMRFRERLTAYERRRHLEPLEASVLPNGKLTLSDDQYLSPSEALRLARWIDDLFSEPK